jgi:hypothetical protein
MRKSPHSQARNEEKRQLIVARNKAIRDRYASLKSDHPKKLPTWYLDKLKWMFFLDEYTLRNILYGFDYHEPKPKERTHAPLFD